ncbi:hypothetical protein [Burkholderia cepacia]|uniref:hypothetical protein n=1 Tax=Burkholderia cepacia TaxID=292 RepID=UPI0009B6E2B2|nr:hypothetical protein [Burkholderia cepacia]
MSAVHGDLHEPVVFAPSGRAVAVRLHVSAAGQAIAAYAAGDTAELLAHVKQVADRGLISRYAVPERLLIVDAIEKTSVGKINKRALRERYQAA